MAAAGGSRAGAVRHVLIGAVGGTFSGLAGLGGGTIMVPLMVRYLGMVQVNAHGTSLGVIIFTAIASAAGYSFSYFPEWGIVLSMVVPALLLAPLGARTATRLESNRLRKVFASFLLVAAFLLLVLADPESIFAFSGTARFVVAALIGVLAGFLSGLLGVGGGILMVPASVFLLSMIQRDAQALALVVMIPTAVSGVYAHTRLQNVDWTAAALLAAASIPFGFVAGWLASEYIPGELLRVLFAILLLYFSARMFEVKFGTLLRRGAAQD
ncbi:MAG: sulfite exporter TauE/SafE family protein [Chloroflexota bacterium]|nr:sulfite exporter TauE/SafE family protein [Chloroflexota bacterium]